MTVEARLAALEARVRELEDHAAVQRLVAAYGPAVDRGDGAAAGELFTSDGRYDVDTGVYSGADGVAEMVQSRPHRRLLDGGCAHLLTPPDIRIDGDRAVAVGHSLLVLRRADGSGYDVLRATSSRWECAREADGWRVVRRTSRLLDGTPQARALLAPSHNRP